MYSEGKVGWRLSPDQTWTVWFLAKGYEPHKQIFDTRTLNKEKDIKIYLSRGRVLAGTIVDDSSGEPIDSSTIQLELISVRTNHPLVQAGSTHNAYSDSEGNFKLSALPSGRFTLRVSAQGYSEKYIQSETLSFSIDNRANLINLFPSSTLYGYLKYSENEPVMSGIVEARLETGEKVRVTNASPSGYYSLDDLPCGRIQIRVKDYTQMYVAGGGEEWFWTREVDLPPNESMRMDFELSGNSRLTGLCSIDDDGLIGIEVKLLELKSNKCLMSAESTNTGVYFLSPVPEGDFIITAESKCDGIGAKIEKRIHVEDREKKVVDFNFSGTGMEGKVKSEQGAAVYACWLTLEGIEEQGVFKAFTDNHGKYTFLALPPGMYQLSLASPGYAQQTDEITISPTSPVRKDYTLTAEGVVKLHVKGSGNVSLKDAVALLQGTAGPSAKPITNGKGMFVFKNLAEGSVTAIAGGKGLAPAAITVGVTAKETVERTMNLSKGGYLTIVARDLEGQPLYGAKVIFDLSGLFGMSWNSLVNHGFINATPATFTTTHTGVFEAGPLPEGLYTITLKHGSAVWKGEAHLVPGGAKKLKAVL